MIVTAHEPGDGYQFRERRSRDDRRVSAEKRSNQERRSWEERRSGNDRRLGVRAQKGLHRRSGEDRRSSAGRGQTADRRVSFEPRDGTERRNRAGRLAFLCIDASTGATLRDLQPLLASRIDEILDDFYAHLTTDDELAALFGDNGIDHARLMQRRHWLEYLFAGNFDDEYLQRAAAIGKNHERMGLEPRWYLAAYCFILNRIVDLVVQEYATHPDRMNEAIQAVTKALFVDMDMAVSSHIDSMKQSDQQRANLSREELATLLEGA